jgi:hypothetical protein
LQPTDAYDSLKYYTEQRDLAQQWLSHLTKQNQDLAKNEQSLDQEYRRKKTGYVNQRRILGLKYSTWENQLRMLNQMIQSQKQLEDEAKKLQQ